MVAGVKHNPFVLNLGLGSFNLNTDTLKFALTNVDPSAVDLYSGITEIANGNGYTTGGAAVTGQSYTQTSGVGTLAATGPTITATGTVGPFQYAFLQNVTASGKVIAHWNYGSALTLNSGDSVTLTIAGTGILTIT